MLPLVAAAIVVAGAAAGEPTARMALQPGSVLSVAGTSNIHDWTCRARAVAASIEVSAALVRRADLTVPVRFLACGNDTMDGKLRDALKASSHPMIRFTLERYEPIASGAVEVGGSLTIAGVTRAITSKVEVERQPDGSVRARASVPLKMTDFGVEPPRALLGALKTGDAITVEFDLRASGAAAAAKTRATMR